MHLTALAANIIQAYVLKNQVTAEHLPELILGVTTTLRGLSEETTADTEDTLEE